MENDRDFAAKPIQVRFDDLKRETDRHRRVERIAALLKDAHARGGAEPMRRGHDAKATDDLRACGERALARIEAVAQAEVSKREVVGRAHNLLPMSIGSVREAIISPRLQQL